MRDLPPVARRSVALCLALALFAVLLPGAVSAQDPIQVEGAFEVSGDSGPGEALYAWHIDEPGLQWQLQADTPGDEQIIFDVWDQERTFSLRAYAPGQAVLYDLALEPGDYSIRVGAHGRRVLAIHPDIERRRPNATIPSPTTRPSSPRPLRWAWKSRAAWLAPAVTTTTSPSRCPRATMGCAISLSSRRARSSETCACGQMTQTQLQCRRGIGTVVLPDLALAPGRYVVSVVGSVDDTEVYRLVVGPSTPRRPTTRQSRTTTSPRPAHSMRAWA